MLDGGDIESSPHVKPLHMKTVYIFIMVSNVALEQTCSSPLRHHRQKGANRVHTDLLVYILFDVSFTWRRCSVIQPCCDCKWYL